MMTTQNTSKVSRKDKPILVNPYQLKEKFLVNFQGFQVELSTEEDFLSCQQYKRETLLDFFCKFLRLKAQAPEDSDDQVITQAKSTGQLHNYLV
jgi:hypothetical protein